MPTYALRRRSRNPNDYWCICDGINVGRCFLRAMSNGEQRWNWTILNAKSFVIGVPTAGYASTLDEANNQFRKSFDRMIAAGVTGHDNASPHGGDLEADR